MASGVPIIASNLPSIREILNEENSFLVQPDSPKTLAEEIQIVFDNLAFAKKKAEKARIDVQKYTWDEYAKKILHFIAQ